MGELKGKVIYSLGTGSRSPEEFVALMKGSDVVTAVDVRSFPFSRRHPHYSQERLRRFLETEGIDYVWLGERLGGFRKGGYSAHMLTEDFRLGLEELERLASRSITAFFCAERDHRRCHRRFIARALEERGWRVLHLGEGSDAATLVGQSSLPLG